MLGCGNKAKLGQEVPAPEEVYGLKGRTHSRAGKISSDRRELNAKGF